MKFLPYSILTLSLCGLLTACGGSTEREGEIDSAEVIDSAPDYEDADPNQNGKVDYVEQSTQQAGVTTNTTNYAPRADSIRMAGDTLVKPKYTDNEYEAAYSTSTTNPANQVAGGVTPSGKQKKQ